MNKQKLNIGILTFHNGINYGGFFQVLAMQSWCESKGYDVKVINYKSLGFTLREWQILFQVRHPLYMISNIVKYFYFKEAFKKLHLTKRMFQPRHLEALFFDRIILGSDEIWNFMSPLIGRDLVYFSKHLSAKKIISYAASFGTVKEDVLFDDEIKKQLKNINFISVRDRNSLDLLDRLNFQAEEVLDPVFLFDFSSQARVPKQKDYILVYGLFDEEAAKKIRLLAEKTGKKILAVGYRQAWADKSIIFLPPFEWLGYFINADIVFTTMFHGMVFSLVNEKEVFVIKTPYREHKVGRFLTDLGLEHRWVRSGEDWHLQEFKPIDYSRVNKILLEKKAASKNFLERALA